MFCWSLSILRRTSCTVLCSETTVFVSSWERLCDGVSITDEDQSCQTNDVLGRISQWEIECVEKLSCFDDGESLVQVCWCGCGGRFATEPRKRSTCILTLIAEATFTALGAFRKSIQNSI
jgi:hypothetical protein